jgi:hypothetical protein
MISSVMKSKIHKLFEFVKNYKHTKLNKLMLKMTCSSKYHSKFVFVAMLNSSFIDPPG